MYIKEIIKSRGLLAKDVAAKMGITPISLSYHINGNPSVSVLRRIAEAIGCEVGEFFDAPAKGTITCPACGTEIKLSIEKV